MCILDGWCKALDFPRDTGSYFRNQISFSHFPQWFSLSVRAWRLMIVLFSKRQCDPPDGYFDHQAFVFVVLIMGRHKSYNVMSQSDNASCHTPTAACIHSPLKKTITRYIIWAGLMTSNRDFKGPGASSGTRFKGNFTTFLPFNFSFFAFPIFPLCLWLHRFGA